MQKWPLYTGLYSLLQNYTAVVDTDQTPVLPVLSHFEYTYFARAGLLAITANHKTGSTVDNGSQVTQGVDPLAAYISR